MFKKTVLDSGITVVTEAHRYQRSVAVGAFINIGTRDEPTKSVGISHFLEHMAFKGTKKRSANEIARSLEAVGGELNAYTTREYTCFHAVSLKDDLALDIDVLGDLVGSARFSQRDFELERRVILQEVMMTEDVPEEYIFDLFFEKVYSKSSLGWPILGSKESLERIKRAELIKYYKERYSAENIIVAAAGCLEHDDVVEKVEKSFKMGKKGSRVPKRTKPRWTPVREVHRKEGEQTHILVGFEGPSFVSPKRFAAFVLNAWLGGGMSSKLNLSIREKRGLAYTVYSSLTTFTDTGALTIYAATEGKNVKYVMDAIHKDISDLRKKKLNSRGLDLFKQQVRGGLLLGADDMDNRMTSLGVNEMTFGDYVPVDAVVDGIDGVTANDVRNLACELLDPNRMGILVMGDVDTVKTKRVIS